MLAETVTGSGMTFDHVNLSAMGLMAWYVFYVTSKTIPRIVSDFKHEMGETRNHYYSEFNQQRNIHREETAAQRSAFHAEMQAIREAHTEDMELIAKAIAQRVNGKHE